MPRYVILTHDHPFLHWDFMLEVGGVLRTWRLVQPPEPGVVVAAELLADHRLAYLDYEGPVSGNRGTVTRWDAGTYEGREEADGWALHLEGGRLRGAARLVQTGADGWQLEVTAPA